ncbi:3-oxoacyl-ACP reductase FabG [Weissella tructae]|uniref:3-oxoacyl-[acyl-carrier-protein] reductase n=2 Tax=Weissella TaxID=46255 RepID=A0A075TVC2_9LACO|nr:MULTISPECIES: 3-oxoacyl-ACP reductase FabG [Weissella]AIG65504.1 3-oxoacyl-[acyl-carrier-protein] reductase [Weissella tructae]AIM62817.1 3-oxoacyl-[acyl-carrier-protein] reductase [Weissella ceti]AIM64152.1 3-oxoacyl-[acyl-carrier-protein] reductase [Weissella ceti]ELA07037.1 3-oxoacyl-ACP reductase [Weissella ceti NC36]QVV91876.1 3-oxoacyl-ACP reductase FabG [Weissella tructae]
MQIADKTVLVTGSTRGIGLAIAQRLSQAGARIILHGRQMPSATLLSQFPENTLVMTGDISDATQMQNAIDDLYANDVTIDILVNNAGIVADGLMVRLPTDAIDRVIDTNLKGTFYVTQPIFKKMMRQRTGVIINMASVVGQMGNVGQANYAAAKAGMIGFTKSLAREGAMRGIRVNAIAPGMIVSDMTDALPDAQKETLLAEIPLKRFGTTTEIAQATQFLIENDYMTGQTITIDGGLHI